MKELLLICSLMASYVSGHMQMSKPFPIRSPLNKGVGEKDYSYTSPLSSTGSDYPCKGYANDPFHSVAVYSPGQEYEMELEGTVTHGGGSCQISLSYNKGKTFHVIHSMLGGCPIPKKYNFKIPSDAPSGEALLAWTWFNKVGNREMYMNCAQVTIKGGLTKRTSLDNLPPIFIANVNGPGKCRTIENEQVNFPLPGPSIEGSLIDKGYKCESSAPFLDSTISDPNSGSISTSLTSASFSVGSSSATDIQHGATSDSGSCTHGAVICAPDSKSWSICANGTPIYMGPVAPGTLCSNSVIAAAA